MRQHLFVYVYLGTPHQRLDRACKLTIVFPCFVTSVWVAWLQFCLFCWSHMNFHLNSLKFCPFLFPGWSFSPIHGEMSSTYGNNFYLKFPGIKIPLFEESLHVCPFRSRDIFRGWTGCRDKPLLKNMRRTGKLTKQRATNHIILRKKTLFRMCEWQASKPLTFEIRASSQLPSAKDEIQEETEKDSHRSRPSVYSSENEGAWGEGAANWGFQTSSPLIRNVVLSPDPRHPQSEWGC